MKYKCVKCGVIYFHNHAIIPPPEKCRFCGGDMIRTKMTDKEFEEMYLSKDSPFFK